MTVTFMTITTDKIIMKTTFGIMNRILKGIDSQMDSDFFDASVLTAEKYGITKNRFARILKMLSDARYIEGVEVIDEGEPDEFDETPYTRFKIIIGEVFLTFKGMEFLAQNTVTAQTFSMLKKIREIAPL